MDVVILAAGRATRFKRAGLPHKLSVKIWDIPLASYPLVSLALLGVVRLIIVSNKETLSIVEGALKTAEKILGSLPETLFIVNEEPEKGNGYSFLLAVEEAGLRGCILVSMADHIYPPSIPEALLEGIGPSIGADSKPLYIDLSEATRIRVEEGRIKGVGKHLENYTHVDIGVHKMPAEAAYACSFQEKLGFSDIITCAARSMDINVIDVRGKPWTEIDTPTDLREALEGRRRRVVEEVVKEWRGRGARLR